MFRIAPNDHIKSMHAGVSAVSVVQWLFDCMSKTQISVLTQPLSFSGDNEQLKSSSLSSKTEVNKH